MHSVTNQINNKSIAIIVPRISNNRPVSRMNEEFIRSPAILISVPTTKKTITQNIIVILCFN